MYRNHAFWGAVCIAVGATLLARQYLHALENVEVLAPAVLGVGLILLGLSFVIKQQLARAIAAFLAGICIGFYAGVALTNERVLRRPIRISCATHDSFDHTTTDEEEQSDEDTAEQHRNNDTLPHLPDTLRQRMKPLY
ncbi:MAG: hypothetical protein KatS3mg039_0573 [Candidatus Kapaibacterium sp.]|nr:MAG: hypothetical protein KatS3mg039_0573 [Candidatus Kapabacteria bacterium]